MYNSIKMEAHVLKLYQKYKKGIVTNRDDKRLNSTEIATVAEMVRGELEREFLEDRPCVDPKKIIAVYGKSFHSLKILNNKNCQELTGATKDEREGLRRDAAKKYAEGLVKTHCYKVLHEYGLQTNRSDDIVYNILNEEKKDEFLKCFMKMTDEYYKDKDEYKNKSPEEIKKEKADANVAKNKIIYQAFKDLFDRRASFLDETWSDTEIIERYPEIASECLLFDEVINMLTDIKKNPPEGITEEQLNELMQNVESLSSKGGFYIKRMTMLADPYYPEVNLEEMFKVNPEDLRQLMDASQSITDREIKDIQNKDYNTVIEVKKRLKNNKFADMISSAESILRLPDDVYLATNGMLVSQIEMGVGGKISDISRSKIFCNKNGKILNVIDAKFGEILNENEGEIYIIDKEGKHNPVPVIVDKSKNEFKVLVGGDAVTDCIRGLHNPEDLKKSQKIYNVLHKGLYFGKESDTVREYNAKINSIEKMRSQREIPEKVSELAKNVVNRSNQINSAEARTARDEVSKSIIKGFRNITLDDARAFDYALGTLLTNSGLNAKRGRFLDTMHRALNVYDNNFKESASIYDFIHKERFREFAWQLRQDKKLMDDLRSGNEVQAKEAVENIINRFVVKFDVKKPWDGSVSNQFKEYIAEADKKLSNTVDVANGKIISELAESSLRRGIDNKMYWENIKAFYGSNREARLDWMPETSDKNVYSMNEFMKMKENDNELNIKLNELNVICNGLDEDTFASLGMILSLKKPDECFLMRNGKKERTLDTVSFEDMVTADYPRDNTSSVLDTIIEPTRKALVNDLKKFKGEGKSSLAKKLADSLKLFVKHSSKYDWQKRNSCALVKVAENVMSFVQRNGMMDQVMANGLNEKDISHLKITIAIGQAVNEGFNAAAKLTLDANGDPKNRLTEEKRLECIDKVMILKVIQADNKLKANVVQNRQQAPARGDNESVDAYNKRIAEFTASAMDSHNNFIPEYSSIARNFEKGGLWVCKLSESLMSREVREGYARKGVKGSREFFKNTINNDKYSDNLANVLNKNKESLDKIIKDTRYVRDKAFFKPTNKLVNKVTKDNAKKSAAIS